MPHAKIEEEEEEEEAEDDEEEARDWLEKLSIDLRSSRWMNEWMNEWMNGWMTSNVIVQNPIETYGVLQNHTEVYRLL